jgi:hypothetical protein
MSWGTYDPDASASKVNRWPMVLLGVVVILCIVTVLA